MVDGESMVKPCRLEKYSGFLDFADDSDLVSVPMTRAIPLSFKVTARVLALLKVWHETLQRIWGGKQMGFLLFLTISRLLVICIGSPEE